MSDCYFETNFEKIQAQWKIKEKIPATEILVGFFAKFLFDYNSVNEVIDISHEGGFRSFETAKKVVESCCHSEKCK